MVASCRYVWLVLAGVLYTVKLLNKQVMHLITDKILPVNITAFHAHNVFLCKRSSLHILLSNLTVIYLCIW